MAHTLSVSVADVVSRILIWRDRMSSSRHSGVQRYIYIAQDPFEPFGGSVFGNPHGGHAGLFGAEAPSKPRFTRTSFVRDLHVGATKAAGGVYLTRTRRSWAQPEVRMASRIRAKRWHRALPSAASQKEAPGGDSPVAQE